MNANETIALMKKRQTIRKFEDQLDSATLKLVKDHISTLTPLDASVKTEIKIVEGSEISGLMKRSAPYFLVAFAEDTKDGRANAGYMLQQMVIYLLSLGLGSGYQGSVKASKNVLDSSGLTYVIAVSFGKPAVDLYRTSIDNIKRKAVNDITNDASLHDLMELVRIAPLQSIHSLGSLPKKEF